MSFTSRERRMHEEFSAVCTWGRMKRTFHRCSEVNGLRKETQRRKRSRTPVTMHFRFRWCEVGGRRARAWAWCRRRERWNDSSSNIFSSCYLSFPIHHLVLVSVARCWITLLPFHFILLLDILLFVLMSSNSPFCYHPLLLLLLFFGFACFDFISFYLIWLFCKSRPPPCTHN